MKEFNLCVDRKKIGWISEKNLNLDEKRESLVPEGEGLPFEYVDCFLIPGFLPMLRDGGFLLSDLHSG